MFFLLVTIWKFFLKEAYFLIERNKTLWQDNVLNHLFVRSLVDTKDWYEIEDGELKFKYEQLDDNNNETILYDSSRRVYIKLKDDNAFSRSSSSSGYVVYAFGDWMCGQLLDILIFSYFFNIFF